MAIASRGLILPPTGLDPLEDTCSRLRCSAAMVAHEWGQASNSFELLLLSQTDATAILGHKFRAKAKEALRSWEFLVD